LFTRKADQVEFNESWPPFHIESIVCPSVISKHRDENVRICRLPLIVYGCETQSYVTIEVIGK